jgi:predicted Rossmann fold nucleotide-binding protein DprA/Smf involved in DNA uptake
LHGRFSGESFARGEGPLSLGEYNRLMRGLAGAGLTPADLYAVGDGVDAVVADCTDGTLDPARVQMLLARGVELAVRLESWESAGVQVIGRSDPSYPSCWTARLGEQRPPFLFWCGDLALLDGHAVGIVGSRDVDDAGRSFAEHVAQSAVRDGYRVISGFARGVDQYAMAAALDAGGDAIGIVSEGLLRAASKSESGAALAAGRMLLVSVCSPDITRFQAWRAMDRNKLVYGAACASVVVEAAVGKGGTWTGAREAMKMQNGHVLVRADGGSPGCERLLDAGGHPLTTSSLASPGWTSPSGPPTGTQGQFWA